LALANKTLTPFNKKAVKWLALVGIAAAFLVAASGVLIHHLAGVSRTWLLASWVVAFIWLFILIRFRLFSGSFRLICLTATIVGFNLLTQTTGGEQSPLTFAVLLLIGIAAWEGEAQYGFWVAILFSLLEFLSLRKEDVPEGMVLILRWAAFLVSAVFLARVVKTRAEKELLNNRLESLKSEAVKLASSAEPSSFNIPKDKLLMEESRISARVGTLMELEDSLNRQLALLQKSRSLHFAGFFLVTSIQEKKVLRLRAFSSFSDSVAADVTVLPGETLIGLAAKEKRRVLLNQMAPESAKALPYYLKGNQIGSFLAQPIYLKHSILETKQADEMELAGILVLDHEKPDVFNENELQLVEHFINIFSDTLQEARVLHFSRTKTRNLHALYEVSNSFSSLLEPNKVLETALKTATEITICDSAYIALAEGDNKKLGIRAWWNPSQTAEKPVQVEDDLTNWVFENKKPIRYTRGQRDKMLSLLSKKEGSLGSIQSFLMVPLVVGENVLGVIRLNSQHPAAYQEYDLDVLTTLANQTALALENALMVQQIQDLAIRDGLTGAFNHRYFQEKLEEELAKAGRYNKDLTLLLLDVDHFKKFNDEYGHQEGDKVLRIVSEILQGTVRDKIDTVARYGGEEFAVILPECDGNAGKELAERIRKNIEGHLFKNKDKVLYRVTVSIGLSSYPFDSSNPGDLIRSSDQALYQAKNDGRNCVRPFKPSYK
jgi:diguanylate cyclase (GGDEF)-like protein